MKKYSVLAILGVLSFAAYCYATDYLGNQISSGTANKQVIAGRWQLARAATTTTSLTSVTNAVLATPGMVRKIVFVPGATNDVLEIHNAASITTATAANEVFRLANINQTVGLPQVYDLAEDWNCSTGITTVIQPGVTSSVSRAYISYDINQ